MKTKIFILVFLVNLSNLVFAQTNDGELFTQGKKFFSQERYNLASDLFNRIIANSESPYRNYAAFYQGICFYKSNNKEKAKDLWLELAFLKPDWKNINEVYFWLATYYHETGNHVGKQRYLNKITNDEVLKDAFSIFTPIDDLISTSNKDTVNANVLTDSTWLANFILRAKNNSYDVKEIASLLEVPNPTRKESYNVAVLLPFMFESLAEPERTSKNSFVMEIYEGIRQGAKKLASEGIKVKILPYDTKKDSAITKSILDKKELRNIDLIIGPLYQKPISATAAYCKENKIPQVNLLSTDITGSGYPYTFYVKPSRGTIANKIFDYVESQNLTDTIKTATIFYQKTQKDQQIAEQYKRILESNGYTINIYRGLEKEEAQVIGEIIGEKKEIVIPIDSVEIKDSILLQYPGVELKTRKAYGLDEDENYFETLVLKKEDIGHILVSASFPSFGASIVSALEIRDDSILTIGNEKWLNPKVIDIQQLARQNVIITSPHYIHDKKSYDQFIKSYVKRFKKYPGQNAITGYETIYNFGRILNQHGRNFSPALLTSPKIRGTICEGLLYDLNPDNQLVPIIKIIDSKLIKVN